MASDEHVILTREELAADRADGFGLEVDAYELDAAWRFDQVILRAGMRPRDDAQAYAAAARKRGEFTMSKTKTRDAVSEAVSAQEKRDRKKRRQLAELIAQATLEGTGLATQSKVKTLSKAKKAELNTAIDALDAELAILREADRRLTLTPVERRHEDNRASLTAPAPYTDGERVAEHAHGVLTRHVAYPDEHGATVDVLWAMLAHEFGSFDMVPFRIITSAEAGSGKSLRGQLIGELTPGFMMAASFSASSIFRQIDFDPTTVFGLDECDAYFLGGQSSSESTESVRAILDSATYPNGYVLRSERDGDGNFVPRQMPTFAPFVLMGIGELPTTIMSRGLVDVMRKALPSENVERYRKRENAAELEELRKDLGAWMAENVDAIVARLGVDLPDELENRDAEKWEGIIAIADVLGGDWPERARAAAIADVTGANRPRTLANRLLGDIREAFGTEDRIAAAELVEKLNRIDDAPWGDYRGEGLTTRSVMRLLTDYRIPATHTIRGIQGYQAPQRGWSLGDFHDAFARYLPDVEPALPTIEI